VMLDPSEHLHHVFSWAKPATHPMILHLILHQDVT